MVAAAVAVAAGLTEAAVVGGTGLYLWGVRRVGRRGRRWPAPRTAAFLTGMAAVAAAISAPLAARDDRSFAVHAVQHLLLSMVAPPLLALGAPVTLGLSAAGRRMRRAVNAGLHSRAMTAVSHPVAAWVLFAASMAAVHLTPLYPLSLHHPLLHAVIHVHILLAGVLFWWRATSWGWSSPRVLGLFVAGALALGAFVVVERRSAHPLLPLGFFARRNFTAAISTQFLMNFAYMGAFIITPLLMQSELGYSVAATSVVMMARPLSFSLSSPIAGYVAARVGERLAALCGSASIVASMVTFVAGAYRHDVALIIVALVLSGLGLGVSQPSLVSSVANAVDAEDLGIASAAQQMTTQIGAVAGIQILTALQAGTHTPGPFATAYTVGALIAAGAVVTAGFVRSLERGAVDPLIALATASPHI